MRIAFFGSSFGRWLAGLSVVPGFKRGRWAARSLAMSRMYGDPTKITAETLEGYSRMMDLPGTIEYALEIVRSWNHDMRELKSRIPRLADMPVLLLWGSLDRAVAPASARQLAAKLRNARLIVMNGMGHMPYEEAPEQFNRLVLDFLDCAGSAAEAGASMSSRELQSPSGGLQR
jgi:pimeloyl-ACP methyl ester carboxylesterase